MRIRSRDRQDSVPVSLLRHVGIASILWSAVLLGDLTGPTTLRHVAANPVLSWSQLLASASFASACLAAGLWGVAAAALARRRGSPRNACGWGAAAVAGASLGILVLRGSLHDAVGDAGLPPLARFAVVLAAGSIAGGATVVACARLAGRGSTGRAVALAWLVVWTVLLLDGMAAGGAPAVELTASTVLAWAALVLVPPQRRGLRMAVVATLALALPLAVLAVAASRSAQTPVRGAARAPRRGAPNVLLLVVDTWRADHTALEGYALETSPVLAELAGERATVFRRAYAPAASTAPSVKGLFTSRSPSHWGLADVDEPPPLDALTLAEAFRASGYATAGFSANSLIRGDGFAQGFDAFLSTGGFSFFRHSFFLYDMLVDRSFWDAMELVESWRLHKASGDAVVAEGRDWLEERPRDRPFFLYVHLIEPHWPYHDYGHGVPGTVLDEEQRVSTVDLLRLPKGAPANVVLRSDPRIRDLVRRYDEGVRDADRLLGAVVAALRELSLDDSTLLVVTGDHGEEFFEHGGFSHGHDVFEEQIHVPLLVRWPRGSRYAAMPRQVTEPVSLLDLFPTLHDLLELADAPAAAAGESLLPLLAGNGFERERPILAEAYPTGRCRLAYVDGRYRVLMEYGPRVSPQATTRLAVFDLAESPEQRKVAKPSPEARALVERARRAAQARWLAWRPADAIGPATGAGWSDERRENPSSGGDAALEQLRALGYVE